MKWLLSVCYFGQILLEWEAINFTSGYATSLVEGWYAFCDITHLLRKIFSLFLAKLKAFSTYGVSKLKATEKAMH